MYWQPFKSCRASGLFNRMYKIKMLRYSDMQQFCLFTFLSLFCFALFFVSSSFDSVLVIGMYCNNFYFMALLVKVWMEIFNLFTRGAPKKSQELVKKMPEHSRIKLKFGNVGF